MQFKVPMPSSLLSSKNAEIPQSFVSAIDDVLADSSIVTSSSIVLSFCLRYHKRVNALFVLANVSRAIALSSATSFCIGAFFGTIVCGESKKPVLKISISDAKGD